MKVYIPFQPRFEEPLVTGKKTWTTRTRPFGKRGDYFGAFGEYFLIDKVELMPLETVLEHWQEEGCNCKQDLIDTWQEIHRRRPVYLTENFYVHVFHKIKEA
jgi:hypothetical protein